MSIPWTKPHTIGTSNKVALILTDYPQNYQPVILKYKDTVSEDDEVTIITQCFDDFAKYEDHRKKYPESVIVAVAVLGYPCRNETVIKKSVPKIAGFWSKLSFIIPPHTTIFLDNEFSCYSQFLGAVGLSPMTGSPPDEYHFSPAASLIHSDWLIKNGRRKITFKKKLKPIIRGPGINFLLYISCKHSEHVNPIEDVIINTVDFKENKQYWRSISMISHLNTGVDYEDLRRKVALSRPTIESFAKHLIECRDANGKRFTLVSFDVDDIEPVYCNVLVLDWEKAVGYLFNLNYEHTDFPIQEVSQFTKELIQHIEFKMWNIKSGPEIDSWQTYGDIFYRFIEYISDITLDIDKKIMRYSLPMFAEESPVDYEKAITFLKNNLFSDQYMDKDMFEEREILGQNLLKWYKTLNSTYPNQIDLQISYHLVKLIGDKRPELSMYEREKYTQLFLTSWVMWFISQIVTKDDMEPDKIFSEYLASAIVPTNFKILLEFCRFVYLQQTDVKPPNSCLVYLSDQYLNLFYESSNYELDLENEE